MMETVKYAKFYNDPTLYEVMGIDPNFEGNGTAYMVNVGDIIEPYGESLIEQVYEQSSDGSIRQSIGPCDDPRCPLANCQGHHDETITNGL